MAVVGPPLGIITSETAGMLAGALLPLLWWTILLSGVIAGWLMGLMT